jgi:hypothetical protein
MERNIENEKIKKMATVKPILGVHFGLFREGKSIAVGDPVYAALK